MKKAITSIVLITAIVISSGHCLSADRSSEKNLTKTDQNTFVHNTSGVQFPAKIGDYTRDSIHSNEPGELGVTATYSTTSPATIHVEVDVYPSPKIPLKKSPDIVVKVSRITMTDHVFDTEKKIITEAHEGAKQISNGKIKGIKFKGDKSIFGRYAAFEYVDSFEGQTQKVTSRLYLFTYLDGKWTVKYRITHSAGAVPDKAAHEFMKRYKWR